MQQQSTEGCQFHGYVAINKVQGNLHISPGKSFNQQGMHIHDLSDYRNEKNNWDFTHTINSLAFGDDIVKNPLDQVTKKSKTSIVFNVEFELYQYFIKVVGTKVVYMNGNVVNTNQFAVTEHDRDVSPVFGTMPTGMPGVFFNFEISPMLVTFTEYRKPFSHFLTDLCAIVGGVFTVAGMIDSILFSAQRKLQFKTDLGKQT